MITYWVIENQNNMLRKDIHNREDAIKIAIRHHTLNPDRYHEIYKHDTVSRKAHGVGQWKPGDCEHRVPKGYNCPKCEE